MAIKRKIRIKKSPPKHNSHEFNLMINEVVTKLLERDVEIEGLKLALLTRNNVLLEGPPGVAKSMLVESMCAQFTDDIKLFSKQLMKGTQIEEIFGPMNIKKFKEESLYEYNTVNTLADCHIAYLDEVYRASDMLLPSMMSVLNEKTFYNGLSKIKCPLISAIGTTNFVTDTEELEAFNDRWLVKIKVNPIQAASNRLKMYNNFLRKTPPRSRKFSLERLICLLEEVDSIRIDEDIILMYDKLIQQLSSNLNSSLITDRRKCWGLKLMQANATLNEKDEVGEEDLEKVKYALIQVNNPQQEAAFTDAFSSVVETFLKQRREQKEVELISSHFLDLEDRFSGSMPLEEAELLYEEALCSITSLKERKDDYLSDNNRSRCLDVRANLEQLKSSIESCFGEAMGLESSKIVPDFPVKLNETDSSEETPLISKTLEKLF